MTVEFLLATLIGVDLVAIGLMTLGMVLYDDGSEM